MFIESRSLTNFEAPEERNVWLLSGAHCNSELKDSFRKIFINIGRSAAGARFAVGT